MAKGLPVQRRRKDDLSVSMVHGGDADWRADGRHKEYFVYVMSNHRMTLYTGITNDLRRRVFEHKTGANEGFTKRYHCDRLVYFQGFPDAPSAIAYEKKMKGMRRSRKIEIIKEKNPEWKDLSEEASRRE